MYMYEDTADVCTNGTANVQVVVEKHQSGTEAHQAANKPSLPSTQTMVVEKSYDLGFTIKSNR